MVWWTSLAIVLLLALPALLSAELVHIGNLRRAYETPSSFPQRETLIKPLEELITLDSPKGKALFSKMLKESNSHQVLALLANLETQMNLGACAPASAVTVLNTLAYKLPYDPTYTMFGAGSYAHWTQDYFILEQCVKNVVGPRVFGQTLESFGNVMECLGLNVDCQHGTGSAEAFGKQLEKHFSQNHVVISNFERSFIHQSAGGHFSPLGGMVDGRVLVLDVARYKYMPIFSGKADILRAMMSFDEQSQKMRGFCAVWE